MSFIELKAGDRPGREAQAGDLVRWRDPKSRAEWGGLRVEFVHANTLVVRGFFGRMAQDGSEHIQTKVANKGDCAVQAAVEEVA